MISAAGAELAGVVIGLDRQERGQGERSAIQEIEREHGVPVLSIIAMTDIIDYLEGANDVPGDALSAMRDYRAEYGC
jgi:orotate phosphoribosyltransferase